ncbi:hypothetical protein BN175_1670002 [Clostridioides difficile T23]|nr:hypothetical protein BN173_2140002 [Clostridioides difficile T11]CCL30516.1 hypothetical protein BN174_1980001 [Clostridioides difficile E15]CCL34495.1 hypothetical protein BN175_1670002 [Clostridioides difficile T23]CCL38353.1 hypothetical protein BN176_2070011 [Clostridioides difficile E19]
MSNKNTIDERYDFADVLSKYSDVFG